MKVVPGTDQSTALEVLSKVFSCPLTASCANPSLTVTQPVLFKRHTFFSCFHYVILSESYYIIFLLTLKAFSISTLQDGFFWYIHGKQCKISYYLSLCEY